MQPWQLVYQVLQADSCGRSVFFFFFFFFFFEHLLDFFICFVKQVLAFSGRQADNFSVVSCSMVFICFHCSTIKSFLQHDLEIVFHSWVTKFVYLQFLRLRTFPGMRIEGKCDFAAYKPMINDQCSSLHWASLWCVVRLSCHAAESERSPEGASV